MRVMPVNFVGYEVVEGALAQRVDHLPPMERFSIAGKGDVLVEHL
jgi:hypothetical protein